MIFPQTPTRGCPCAVDVRYLDAITVPFTVRAEFSLDVIWNYEAADGILGSASGVPISAPMQGQQTPLNGQPSQVGRFVFRFYPASGGRDKPKVLASPSRKN